MKAVGTYSLLDGGWVICNSACSTTRLNELKEYQEEHKLVENTSLERTQTCREHKLVENTIL